jgi:3-oxoacyl-[acyl-carrier protein] reductase
MTSSVGGSPASRVAIVAGATRGIGRATARRLAREGWWVVVTYAHDQRQAESTVETILASGGVAEAVRADVTDELDVERLFCEALAACGGVDAVVQAVIGTLAPSRALANVQLEEFEALNKNGARAAFLVNREAARHLRAGGAIVNITSVAVTRPRARTAADAAGRAAIDALTRVAALELAERDITVNAVALDVAGRCRPDHVADAVAYLLSEGARGITGQVVRIDDPTWELGTRRNGAVPSA